MPSAIHTENLSKIYRGKKGKRVDALKNLTLDIKPGETFGFIGPNGAGKTTAIKILTGLAFPTSGKASIFDQPVARPETRKNIGTLSEVASYSPYFEALELLEALGSLHGMAPTAAREKSGEMLRLVGLEERKKSRLGEFSKGMLQRFGIAQALLHDPKLLILDEPTSGLDPIAQRDVLDVLRRMKARGITLFFSSHRLVEVEGLCDYVGIVSMGDLIFHGTLADLEAQEDETPYLIRYTGENSKNLRETSAARPQLDKALGELRARGASVVTVAPQRSPLEDLFVRMITRHQGGKIIS